MQYYKETYKSKVLKMRSSLAKVSSNWTRVGGCTFLESVQEHVADADFFIRPNLNELVDEEKSILLSKEQSSEHCELCIQLFREYKIQAVSFVCNVLKVEIFHGPIKEYLQTSYGVILDESDDIFRGYRYDVEIEKSGITDLTLRFLTDSSDVCIFGIILHIAPNPNGITTLLPNTGCMNDLENLLQNSLKLRDTVPDEREKLFKQKDNIGREQISSTMRNANEDIFKSLKSHLDKQLEGMERRLNTYLQEMEERQNQKLSTILQTLEKISQ